MLTDSDNIASHEQTAPDEPIKWNVVTPFNWDKMPIESTLHIAKGALDQAMTMTFDSIKSVVIEQLDSKKELPVHLQVRATRDLKVGELVLTPFSMLDRSMLVQNSKASNKDRERGLKPDPSQMDDTCVPRVFMKVSTKESKRGPSCHVSEKFYVTSPRFFTRELLSGDPVTNDLAPLWAITKTNANGQVNMKLDTISFDFAPMVVNSGKVPNPIKKPMWTVVMQVATNIKKIKKNDVLHLTMMVDVESESDVSDDPASEAASADSDK